VRGEVWLAGIPGARETRLTPSKETCRRLARKPADEQDKYTRSLYEYGILNGYYKDYRTL
jgi:hypothetical protein